MTEGRRFRPTLWASVAALAGTLLLLALGSWQIQRLQWKEALIAELTSRMTVPAVDLPLDLSDPAALEHRRFRLAGRFRHEAEFHLGSKTYKGQVGFRIVTPFVLSDGRQVLVDRGWVPVARRDPATRPDGQVAGSVTIEGIARRDGWTGSAWFRPDNRPDENYWFWVDVAAMGARLDGVRPVAGLYLRAVAADLPGGLPRGDPGGVRLSNNHLQYAITWYALAVALVVIYLLFSTRARPEGVD